VGVCVWVGGWVGGCVRVFVQIDTYTHDLALIVEVAQCDNIHNLSMRREFLL
jgi:hypothetical protein